MPSKNEKFKMKNLESQFKMNFYQSFFPFSSFSFQFAME